MRLRTLLVPVPLLLTACGGGGKYSYTNVTVSIAPGPTSLAVNSTTTVTATARNVPPSSITWSLGGGSFNAPGTLSTTSGPTVTYTAPAASPIYGSALQSDLESRVVLTANAPTTANFLGVSTSQTILITQPSVDIGIAELHDAASLPSIHLGDRINLTPYVVGVADTAYAVSINGIPNGSATVGSFSNFSYTAPATMPVTGSTITITVTAHADPTRSTTTTLTLEP